MKSYFTYELLSQQNPPLAIAMHSTLVNQLSLETFNGDYCANVDIPSENQQRSRTAINVFDFLKSSERQDVDMLVVVNTMAAAVPATAERVVGHGEDGVINSEEMRLGMSKDAALMCEVSRTKNESTHVQEGDVASTKNCENSDKDEKESWAVHAGGIVEGEDNSGRNDDVAYVVGLGLLPAGEENDMGQAVLCFLCFSLCILIAGSLYRLLSFTSTSLTTLFKSTVYQRRSSVAKSKDKKTHLASRIVGLVPRCGLFVFSAWLWFPSLVLGTSDTCILPATYSELFLNGIDMLEDRVESETVNFLNGIGLGPLGDTLLLSDVLNLKSNVTDVVFSGNRSTWINGANDLAATFDTNLQNVIGANLGGLHVGCSLNETEQRLHFELSFNGNATVSPSPLLDASIAILPDPLPSLNIATSPFEIFYSFELPLIVDVDDKKVSIGETKVSFNAKFAGNVTQDLPILPNDGAVTFSGAFNLMANFFYSSVSGWAYGGSYNGSLEAAAAASTSTANLVLRASDNNFFDSVPPTVRFDFDVCAFKTDLITAIGNFQLNGEIATLLDSRLDLGGNELFDSTFVTTVKDRIATEAELQVNSIKTGIVNEINSITNCRRSVVEIGDGGVQRELQDLDSTFGFLTEQLESLDGVKSAVAGYFPDRNELAVSVVIRVSENLRKDDIRPAVANILDKLDAASAMFGAGGNVPNVAELLDSLFNSTAIAAFDMELSFGVKVGELTSFFDGDSNAARSARSYALTKSM